ncbi:LapA family protein [Corynebacterium urogenitale]
MTNNISPEPQRQPYNPAEPQVPTNGVAPQNAPAAQTHPAEPKNKKSKKNKDKGQKVQGSAAGSTWVALIIGALLLILLLVFILQNQQSVKLQLFVWEMNFPIGIGVLIAAIVGALIMALVGGVRIIQLRREVNRRR